MAASSAVRRHKQKVERAHEQLLGVRRLELVHLRSIDQQTPILASFYLFVAENNKTPLPPPLAIKTRKKKLARLARRKAGFGARRLSAGRGRRQRQLRVRARAVAEAEDGQGTWRQFAGYTFR